MTALAGLDDIPGSDNFTGEQQSQAEAALATASTVVQAYCRRKFATDQYTTRIRARGQWLLLAQRPVLSVESVSVIVLGQPTATTGWYWDGLDRIWIGDLGVVLNLSEDLLDAVRWGVTVADVVYTAGYAEVPDDVRLVVAGLAARALAIPMGGIFTQQQAGPFAATVAPWAQGGPLTLSDADKSILRQYRRTGATVELRS